jgi:hypothetical protein
MARARRVRSASQVTNASTAAISASGDVHPVRKRRRRVQSLLRPAIANVRFMDRLAGRAMAVVGRIRPLAPLPANDPVGWKPGAETDRTEVCSAPIAVVPGRVAATRMHVWSLLLGCLLGVDSGPSERPPPASPAILCQTRRRVAATEDCPTGLAGRDVSENRTARTTKRAVRKELHNEIE